MATKKTTIVITSILTLVVGYVIGALFGWPSINPDSISGDIGKVKKHKAAVVSEQEALMEQKLRTDSTFMAQTTYTLAFISARISEFKENAALTANVSAEYPEMQKYKESMSDLASLAANAQQAASSALVALNKISNGEEGSSYEEFSNNALLSYLLLEKGLSISKDFVSDTDAFLNGKKLDDYQMLALVRDMWVNYNLVTALMNEDNALIAYWDKAGSKLPLDMAKLALGNTPVAYQTSLSMAFLFNSQIIGNSSRQFAVLTLMNNDRLGQVIRVTPNTGALGLFLSHDQVFRNQTQISFSSSDMGAGVKLNLANKESLSSTINLSGALNSNSLFGVSSGLGFLQNNSLGML